MTAEFDQAIKEKHLYYQNLQSKMERLRQKWKNHDSRIASLPPIVKPVVSFLDGFRSPEGHDRFMLWLQESSRIFQEVKVLIKNTPGTYHLTHLTYNAYTVRDLGFPEFTYGFRPGLDGKPLEKPFDRILFWGNGIMARRAEDNVPLIEIRKDEAPLLHLPENFAFIITKHKYVTEIDIDPEPDVVYAAWMPELTRDPRAIKVAEDVVIPWKNSVEEAKVFNGTEEVTTLEFK